MSKSSKAITKHSKSLPKKDGNAPVSSKNKNAFSADKSKLDSTESTTSSQSSHTLQADACSSKAIHQNIEAIPRNPETIIGYVHNLSPIKRNKRNTIDYTSFTLQLSENTKQPALCFSKTKRKILEEKSTTRTPVKIMRYTKSTDKSKIIINDKTVLSAPDDLDYNFQYADVDDCPITSIADLIAENSSTEDDVTVCAKIMSIGRLKTVKSNKVAELIIRDQTSSIQLDLWNEQINQITENNVYRFSNLSTTYWNNVKKLTGTFNTTIKHIDDVILSAIQNDDHDNTTSTSETEITITSFFLLEDVQRYKICCNCKKRISQVTGEIVKCEHCKHKMRRVNCSSQLCAHVIVVIDDEKVCLTIFEDCIKALVGEFDHGSVDTDEVGDKLMNCNNLRITYNDRSIITAANAAD